MVRRLLLTALLATLAVALPAAAEEDPSSSGPEPAAFLGCHALDPFCMPALDEPWSQAATPVFQPWGAVGDDAFDCRAFDLSGESDPMHAIDPDGCWWRLVRRTLGIGQETSLSASTWASDSLAPALP